jgi:hypothetical protein
MKEKRKLLELFAGSRSMGKVGESLDMEVFSVDWEKYDDINLSIDIGEMKKEDVPFIPDVIWASPDCTTYSIAACSTHRTNSIEPKSDYAKKCDQVNQHFIGLIKEWLKINPSMVFFIENPRGMLRKMPFMQEFKRHTIWYCFSGETKVITDKGSVELEKLSGNNHNLLMRDGTWKNVPIRCYGKQKLFKITLKRSGVEHCVFATANHKWFIRLSNGREVIVNTLGLKNKDIIPTVYSKKGFSHLDDEGIKRGFIFGDEYVNYSGKNKKSYESVVQFCEKKDEELINYFDGLGRSRRYNKSDLNISGFPFEWKKEIPSIYDYSLDYIAGWLSGYFATRGTVDENGKVTMYSTSQENMLKFKDLCQYIGIGTYFVKECKRKGFGDEKTKLYSLRLIRNTIPDFFYLLSHHRNNNFKSKYEPYWSVLSVEESDRIEKVYCAEVEDYESFILDGNILTHNCQYGDDRAKPTDIWTNSTDWVPKPVCHNGNKNCHHQPAPRGSKTGTQGRKGSYERSKIPHELCVEVLKSVKK